MELDFVNTYLQQYDLTAVSLLNPKILEILLSAHARTLQADILHLDQKAAKCTTCKPVCGKF